MAFDLVGLPSLVREEIEARMCFRDRCALRCTSSVAMTGCDGNQDRVSAAAAVLCHALRSRGTWRNNSCEWTHAVSGGAVISITVADPSYVFITYGRVGKETYVDRSASRSDVGSAISRIRHSVAQTAPRVAVFNHIMDVLVRDMLHELPHDAPMTI